MTTGKWGVWATRSNGSIFGADAKWCREDRELILLTEGQAKELARLYNKTTRSTNLTYEAKPYECASQR